jgi:hypothetical protein
VHLLAIGGSDGGISAALRARELDPSVDVAVMLADAFPNFSICGIPYYVSGEVTHWRNLAHRTAEDIEALGIRLMTDTTARRIDVDAHRVTATDQAGTERSVDYDAVVIATGAVPVRPPIGGLDELRPSDGVHVLHTMADTFAVMDTIERVSARTAVIVGAGYIGLEMAEALTTRGLAVTQIEQLAEVLPTRTRTGVSAATDGRRLMSGLAGFRRGAGRGRTGAARVTLVADSAATHRVAVGQHRVDLPGRTVGVRDPDLVLDGVATAHAFLGGRVEPVSGQAGLGGGDVARRADFDAEVVERCRSLGVLDQDELEGRLIDREVGIARSALGRTHTEEPRVELHCGVDVRHVEGQLHTGHGSEPPRLTASYR